jgi:hypothetical protein
MNERIKELAKQSGHMMEFEINDLPCLHYYAKGIGWVTIDPLMEKFAELIVQECVTVGSKAFFADNSTVPVFPSTAIKDYFGIKE